MKNCRFTEKLIQKFLDKTISPEEERKLINHTQECEKCKKEFETYTNIFHKLKTIPYQPLPDNFEYRLHQKLSEYIVKKEKFTVYKLLLPSVAIATVALIVILSSMVIQRSKYKSYSCIFYSAEESYTLAGIEGSDVLPLYSKGNLRIKLKTDKKLSNVEVSINIPAQLCIDGKPKTVKWRGDLYPGENYLILNIIGQSSGVFPIDVSIKQDSKKKTIKTSLKIT